MRLSPLWVAVAAISAPFDLSLPAKGQTSKLPAVGTEKNSEFGIRNSEFGILLTAKPKTVASKQMLLAQANAPTDQPLTTPPLPAPTNTRPTAPNPAAPTPAPTKPSAPNQTAPKPAPTNPSVPDTVEPLPQPIRPPGTQSSPQQETPNQIQVPLNPGRPPTIQNNIPTPQPSTPPPPGNAQPSAAPQVQEPRVLAAEVVVRSEQGTLTPELQNQIYAAIRTQPGRTTTRTQLQEDINAIFATGYFSDVRAVPEDTPLGVRVTFLVQPNPILRNVQVQANVGTGVPSVLPPGLVNNIFRPQYGTILNLRTFQDSIKQLNKWYQDNGYVLAQVVGAPRVAADGSVTLQVAEGVIEDIQVRLRNKQGEETNANGKPYRGRTRTFIITRELELRPGKVFNRVIVQRDLQRVYRLGIFEDVQVALNPGQDPRRVVVVVNVNEKSTGSIVAGAGIGSASGLFGTLSYQQQNLGGNNQTLGAEVQVGGIGRGTIGSDLGFDVRFTDPWIAGDPYRTSYSVNFFDRRSISLIFDGHGRNSPSIYLPNGDRPRINRLGGGVEFTRPLSKDPFKAAEWTASAGLQYQRVTIEDSNSLVRRYAVYGPNNQFQEPLSYSGTGRDDLYTLQLGVVRDKRNDFLSPTNGSLFRVGLEQSVPLGSGSILLTRVRGSYSKYFPVRITKFTKGPQALAFNVQAGTILGDLPPYEAFALGGSNSVRGFDEGYLGSGRSFAQATAEYRFPLFSIISGALFFDVGSDLGTGSTVLGDPAGIRGKVGTGYGYGIGVRVRSPLGPIRLDYGFSSEGLSRLHFGIGERF